MAEEEIIQHYQPRDRVNVLFEGEWIQGRINELQSYTILDPSSGRQRDVSADQIREPDGNLGVGDHVEFRPNRISDWVPGTIVTLNYWVDTEDGDANEYSYLNIRPRERGETEDEDEDEDEDGHANERQYVNIFTRGEETEDEDEDEYEVAPQPQPTGVAWEIHNAFDNFKFDRFMEIINRANGTNRNFKNSERPLQPLIDNINANTSLSQEQKTELTQKIDIIYDNITDYSRYDENIDNITACVQYVLMQPQEFIDTYNQTFITDCLKAYTSGDGMSCVKGMYERIYFAFRDTVSTLCLDQIQGIGTAPLCKPEYLEIYECFYESLSQELLNEYSREWYAEKGDEALGNLSEEARIEDFVNFVRGRMNDEARFAAAEPSIRKYANTEINILFGGKRRRRTIKKRSVGKNRKTLKKRKNKTIKKRKLKTIKKRKNKTIKKQSGSKKRR